METATSESYSIVALDKFIQATRDSGYKGTPSAVAELVDNSVQAGARRVDISITCGEDPEFPIDVVITDDGSGMDPFTLRQALRFGGSSRFDDRKGMGRYGMGLPNSSLSQARRVDVSTWISEGNAYAAHLDVDEIASGEVTEVPQPRPVGSRSSLGRTPSGTEVRWTRCDRLDNRRISTVARKLQLALGRRFRHFIWQGVEIRVNGHRVEPMDPLFLHPEAQYSGARQFGDELVYEVSAGTSEPEKVGEVRVRFSELPVSEWSKLSNKEKRARGISKGAGVTVVRAGREVDYGWFFLGGKRRENYDDWWRCEIRFEPILDEAFGITHTKQQIRPQAHLLEALSEDIAEAARALNKRARRAHLEARAAEMFTHSEQLAGDRGRALAPLPTTTRPRDSRVLQTIPRPGATTAPAGSPSYTIVKAPLRDTQFFDCARSGGDLTLVLNPDHPFYKQVYGPLVDATDGPSRALRTQLDLVLLAAARSQAQVDDEATLRAIDEMVRRWSDTLATFLNG